MTRTDDREARGYGADHLRERAKWVGKVAAGTLHCANPNCLRPDDPLIHPDEPWDLGHLPDRSGYRGPEHRQCNRSEGGRNGAATTNQRRTMTIRTWGEP